MTPRREVSDYGITTVKAASFSTPKVAPYKSGYDYSEQLSLRYRIARIERLILKPVA